MASDSVNTLSVVVQGFHYSAIQPEYGCFRKQQILCFHNKTSIFKISDYPSWICYFEAALPVSLYAVASWKQNTVFLTMNFKVFSLWSAIWNSKTTWSSWLNKKLTEYQPRVDHVLERTFAKHFWQGGQPLQRNITTRRGTGILQEAHLSRARPPKVIKQHQRSGISPRNSSGDCIQTEIVNIHLTVAYPWDSSMQ